MPPLMSKTTIRVPDGEGGGVGLLIIVKYIGKLIRLHPLNQLIGSLPSSEALAPFCRTPPSTEYRANPILQWIEADENQQKLLATATSLQGSKN